MKLIILLLALGLERQFNIADYIKRFCWFDNYMEKIKLQLSETVLWQPTGILLIAIFPAIFLMGLILFLLDDYWFGFINFVLSFCVLVYCLGPNDIKKAVKPYLEAADNGENELAETMGNNLLDDSIPLSGGRLTRAISAKLFVESYYQQFSIIFWFTFLGPLGALFFRMNHLLLGWTKKNELPVDFQQTMVSILDWAPMRLVGFSYSLVGNFLVGFSAWRKNIFCAFNKSEDFLVYTGLAAIEADAEDVATASMPEETRAIVELIERTLTLQLVFVALLILAILRSY